MRTPLPVLDCRRRTVPLRRCWTLGTLDPVKDRVVARNLFVLLFLSFALLPDFVSSSPDVRPEDIQTVLPKDAIEAILDPSFEAASEATWLADSDPVIGVSINGDARAYPVPILSGREIVNDTVGGVPIAVTW